MKKHRVSLIGLAFVALVVLVIVFLVRLTMRSTPEVSLPTPDDSANSGEVIPDTQQEAIRRVEVTPETVQLVIEGLARPAEYSRTVTITRYWAEGSGESVAETATAGDWTRLDVSENGATRHVVTNAAQTWVWYDEESEYYTGAAALTADEEESIPTYENILALPADAIAAADYRARDAVNCIYVETYPDVAGYTERYWIAVDNGLLVAAERALGESIVYAMAGMEVTVNDVDAEQFTLPDGTVLFDPEAEP